MASLTYTQIEDIPKVRPSFSLPSSTTGEGSSQIHATAREAFASDKTKSIAFRKAQIAQVGYMLKDNEQRIMDAFKSDLGRPYQETELYVSSLP